MSEVVCVAAPVSKGSDRLAVLVTVIGQFRYTQFWQRKIGMAFLCFLMLSAAREGSFLSLAGGQPVLLFR
jgi:hypothetical protein